MTTMPTPQDLHPAMRDWLARIGELAAAYPQSGLHGPGLSLADRRLHYLDSCALIDGEPIRGVRIEELSIPLTGRTLAARRYHLQSAGIDSMMAYFHGGGWVVGDLVTHDRLCAHLAQRLGATVVSVDYRRSPEHGAAAVCADAVEATAWLQSRMSSFGSKRLVTGGDSSGAHLAAWAAHALPQAVQAMLLLYPVARRQFDSLSFRERGAGPGLTTDGMRWFWQQFIQTEVDLGDPRQDLTRLWLVNSPPPPTTLLAAWHDPLHDDAVLLADHLRARGGTVQWHQAMDMSHGFARYLGVEPDAREHLDQALDSFRRLLS
jgi:acetyl esterase